MKPKFTATFGHIISASEVQTGELLKISEASYQGIQEFIPYVDYYKNADLVGLAFDVAVANIFNKNGDGIDSDGSIKIRDTLIHKPINVEHDRSTIIGHIMTGGFTSREWGTYLTADNVRGKTTPFNLTVGGCIYRVVAKDLTEVLLAIQKGEKTDFAVAASWEVGFDKYKIAVGNRLLGECSEVIEEDDDRFEGYSKMLKCFGGKGLNNDGLSVCRLIDSSGEIVFLGAGLTKYPAADVGPVYVFDYYDSDSSCKKTSQSSNNDVIDLRLDNNMTKEEIAKMINEALKASADAKTLNLESVASVTDKVAEAIVKSNETFVKQKEEAEAKAKAVEAKAKEQEDRISGLETKVKETDSALSAANEKLAKFEEEKNAALAKDKFNERMGVIDSLFELADSDREVIAKQLSAVESDEEFNTMKANLEVLMSSKLKTKIAEAKAAEEKKLSEAVAEELKKRGVTDPLEGKKSTENVPPNNSAAASEKKETIADRFAKAFDKKSVKVTI